MLFVKDIVGFIVRVCNNLNNICHVGIHLIIYRIEDNKFPR
jgi:hypothetical protein